MTSSIALSNHFNFTRYVTVGVGYFVILLSFAMYYGAFELTQDEAHIRIRNAAITMPLMTVFGFISTQFLLSKSMVSLKYMLEQSSAQKYTHVLVANFFHKIQKLRILSLVCGITITFSYLYLEDLLALEREPLIMFMNLSAIPFWSAMSFFVLNLFCITRYVINNFLDRDSLDLFGIKQLKPISDLVIYNTAVFACIMAIIPMFWLGKTIPLLDIVMVCVAFIIFAVFLFLPVFRVQQVIAQKKKMAIERINFAINRLMIENCVSAHVEVLSRADLIRELASLISAKQEIHASSEWPIDLPQGIRGLALGLSVPLSWAAGSLVETYISSFNWF